MCFLKLKFVLLEVGYIEKWSKFADLESKFPHLKFRVMQNSTGIEFNWHLSISMDLLPIQPVEFDRA